MAITGHSTHAMFDTATQIEYPVNEETSPRVLSKLVWRYHTPSHKGEEISPWDNIAMLSVPEEKMFAILSVPEEGETPPCCVSSEGKVHMSSDVSGLGSSSGSATSLQGVDEGCFGSKAFYRVNVS